MKKADNSHTLDELCRLFELSLSSYYYQINHLTCSIVSHQIIAEMQVVSEETDQTYGK